MQDLVLWVFQHFLISYAWNLKSIGELCLFQWSYFNEIRYIFYDIRILHLILFLFELITRYKIKISCLLMQEPTINNYIELFPTP